MLLTFDALAAAPPADEALLPLGAAPSAAYLASVEEQQPPIPAGRVCTAGACPDAWKGS